MENKHREESRVMKGSTPQATGARTTQDSVYGEVPEEVKEVKYLGSKVFEIG